MGDYRNVFDLETTAAQWDRDYYHPIAERLYDQAIEDMLRLMEVPKGETVLDAGCGPGKHAVRVARHGYRVCAIDLSNNMLQHARQLAKEANVSESISFQQEDLTRLSFPDRTFQYAFSWGVIIHIPDAERALTELARVLKPGGKLALYLVNQSALDHKIESIIRFACRKPLQNVQRLPLGDGIWYEMGPERLWLWRFSIPKLSAFLRTIGLQLRHRRIGEFSEFQRRTTGMPRQALLRWNNFAYRLRLPARIGVTNLLVYEKTSENAGRRVSP